ncbi:hypothetical protein BXZ70DRAFT_1003592 [Cristinia sonorae]|uniref:Chromatin modification-related protein n=1 Tax=Cristinia sonorae TaxID=1940300 RepID=A0A8K0XV34_9AGAR|nr:hypothetical protein BXZ70DRAFT_1003592 [Cristinia sonorae]
MVSFKHRKRRRSQAFPGEDEITLTEQSSRHVSEPIDLIEPQDAPNVKDTKEDREEVDLERFEKEQGTWDAFREEFFEVIDQLPLSLQRSFLLIKELDLQAHKHIPELLSTIQEYLRHRKVTGLPQPDEVQVEGASTSAVSLTSQPPPPIQPDSPPPAETPRLLRRSSTRSPVKHASKAATPSRPIVISRPTTSAPPPPPLTSKQRSASLLTKIARLSEELVRTSIEKINVARHANNIVIRHIKELDRAIKEQETSLSLGLRPGTHPASIILPELVIPKARSNGPIYDTSESEDEPMDVIIEDSPAVEERPVPPEEEKPAKTPRKKGRVKHARKKSDVERTDPVEVAEVAEKADAGPEGRPVRSSRSLKLTLPAIATISALKDAEAAIAPDEPRYCYCNQVSYGEMIGCDGENCQREWYHLGCLGLEQLPTDDVWYCPDCRKSSTSKRRKGR